MKGFTSAYEQGPLSWQQSYRLAVEQKSQGSQWNLTATFAIPEYLSTAEIRTRLAKLIQVEDALRITRILAGDGGYATYSRTMTAPLRELRATNPGEVSAAVSAESNRQFSREGGPLWSVNISSYLDLNGAMIRHLTAVFDHMISDAFSLQAFKKYVITGKLDNTSRPGRYREWVDWQKEVFSQAGPRAWTSCREFWLHHLDGTPADRPVNLPFCSPAVSSGSGLVQALRFTLPISRSDLCALSGKLHVTPLVPVLSATAAATAVASGTHDITLKLVTSGRMPSFYDVLGWLSSCVPIRLRANDLGDPSQALQAARSAWFGMLEFQMTPWEYIWALPDGQAASSGSYGPPQVLLNFIPHVPDQVNIVPRDDVSVGPGSMSSLHLVVAPGADDFYQLECIFDPGRFMAGEIPKFAELFKTSLMQLARLCRQ